MRKGRKQELKGGDEYDVVYARSLYCYLHNRPKNVLKAKRRMNKRERALAKSSLKEELDVE